MKKILLLLMLFGLGSLSVPAQKNKTKQSTQKVESKKKSQGKQTERQRLEAQKKQVQQKQAAARKRKQELEKKVKTGLENVQLLDADIAAQTELIDSIQTDIVALDSSIKVLDEELVVLKKELEERKDRYMKSVRYIYRNRKTQNKMMFVFSSKNFNQMYRRLKYTNDFSTYQKAQGEAVKMKSEQVNKKQDELKVAKDDKTALLARSRGEQRKLEAKQEAQRKQVEDLKKEQTTVNRLIAQQQKEERDLDARIERAIKAEIARAEAEARRRAEEERRKQEALANKENKTNKTSTKTRKTRKESSKSEDFELPAADRVLSGNFESNKGKLPIPITGGYNLIRGLGLYSVSGMKGVTLESKGLYFKGQAGAQARCIFDGQVTAILQRGSSYTVMVRHGRYISVYCNLSSVNVSKMQSVKTNQILGTVGEDNILQFQLRNWTKLLNPKPWLSR